MRIKFEVAYRGVLTAERFYPANTVIDMDDATAQALIEAGRAAATGESVQWGQAPLANGGLIAADPLRWEWIAPLAELGVTTLVGLAGAEIKTLVQVKGIGEKTAARLVAWAQKSLETQGQGA